MGICQNKENYQETERSRNKKQERLFDRKPDGGVSNPKPQPKIDIKVDKKPQFLSSPSNNAFPDEANISPIHHHKGHHPKEQPHKGHHHGGHPHRIHHHEEHHKGHHNDYGGNHFGYHESAGNDFGGNDAGGGDL